MFKTSLVLILLMGLGGLWWASTITMSQEGPRAVQGINAQHTNADGWPTPRNAAQLLAIECARAVGIDPRGTINMQQVRDLEMCAKLVHRALTADR